MKIGIVLLILALAFSLYAQQNVIEEGFEGGTLPDGWTQEYMSGDHDWTFENGGHSGHPSAAHTGSYNALFYWEDTDAVLTRLITPPFNISGSAATLNFWHAQGLWENDQDQLHIYFQENSGSGWTILASYTEDISSWTEVEIELPDGSSNSRIAFEGVGAYGWGVCLDDVVVTALGPEFNNDLQALSIEGTDNPSVGDPYEYFVTVRNTGAFTQDDYQVRLVFEDGTVIDQTAGVELALNEEETFELNWTPDETGAFSLRGEVVLTGDENPGNNLTLLHPVTVHPYGTVVISVGDGTDTSYRVPLNFFYRSSLTETMYYPDELVINGEINTIEYYNSFVSTLPSKPVQIWMGETTQSSLEGGWIPANELTLVFDGIVTLFPGENAVQIPLDDPYYYDGNNLVVLVRRPFEDNFYEETDTFFISENPDEYPSRTVRWQSDSEDNDPNNPDTGTVVDYFPNTTFYFTAGSATGIMGSVTDQNGQAIGGVTIELTPGGDIATTNIEGFYQFYGLDNGTFSMNYSKNDYFDGVVENINLEDDQMLLIDLDIMEKLDITFSIVTNTGNPGGITITGISADSLNTFEVVTGGDGIAVASDVYPFDYNLTAMSIDLVSWSLQNAHLYSNLQVTVNMDEAILMPLNPTCTTEAEFTWQSPYTQSRMLQEYHVYLDGEYVATTTDTTYTFDPDSLVIDDSYTAGVVAVFETDSSEMAQVDFVFEGVATNPSASAPVVTGISGIYPNPFNPDTNIRFDLQQPSMVKLDIYNVRGQKVRSLTNHRYPSGTHTVQWNGTDDTGKHAATGIYYLRMQTDRSSFVRKMMLLK